MRKVFLFALMFMAFVVSPVFAGQGRGSVVSIQGTTTVAGEDVIVEILVLVRPGEDAREKARGALKRMVPDAVKINSFNYTTTGLLWNQFFDNNLDNDYVTVNYNGLNAPAGLDDSLLFAAMDTWTDVNSSSFEFSYGGPTDRCPSLVKECPGRQKFDRNNDVAWVDLNEPGVLGVTWSGTRKDEFDMALDPAFLWVDNEVDPGYDVQTVWAHEFGHAAGLGHSQYQEALMWWQYSGPRRILDQDDIQGISDLYPSGVVDEPPVVSIIDPADSASFSNGETITFVGSAFDYEDTTISSADISWYSSNDGYLGTGGSVSTTLASDKVHVITAEVTDSAANTGNDSITITVGTPAVASMVRVKSVDYTGTGGKNQNVHLLIIVTIEDNLLNPVEGASVSIELNLDGASFGTGTGVTGSDGTITFKARKAPPGCYATTVTNVTAAGLNWTDQTTPDDGFCK